MTLSLIVLTGQSGSGKSTAIRTLEDHGFFCVDNIPTRLVERLVEMADEEPAVANLALVMDVRERRLTDEAPRLMQRLRAAKIDLRVVYLEASEETLVRRYSETRRRHPLDDGRGLREAIVREREILAPMRELADETLDTSAYSPHELRAHLLERLVNVRPGDALHIAIVSFGFKHGVPLEADMVLDVRFLPNPFFDPTLRELSGLERAVRHHVVASTEGAAFLKEARSFLGFLLPHYQREGRRYLTVAVGCTGGQHRSVAVVEALADDLTASGFAVQRRHRDL